MARLTSGDHQVALRLPRWLYEDIVKCAKQSGWDVSKQIRFELSSLRGKAPVPYLPKRTPSD